MPLRDILVCLDPTAAGEARLRRESLFGGVTRDLLDHTTVPVLMSH